MRLHFQETPWDLYFVLIYAAIATSILLIIGGTLLALFLVLFVPGYVSVAALFPGEVYGEGHEIDWPERFVLSLALSIGLVALLGLLLNFTPWGIRFLPLAVTIAIFSMGVGVGAYLRRMRLPSKRRLSLTINLQMPDLTGYTVADKVLSILLVLGIVLASGALGYTALSPPPRETSTQFYILGTGGNASEYPTALDASQNGSVIVGIADHEGMAMIYTVRVDLVGIRIVFNSTEAFNETVEVNRTTWSTFVVTLDDGQSWTQPYTFRINYTGLWKVQFLLFKDGGFATAYRELHLYVQVT